MQRRGKKERYQRHNEDHCVGDMVDFETVMGVLEIRLERWVKRGRVPDNSTPTMSALVDNPCKDKVVFLLLSLYS